MHDQAMNWLKHTRSAYHFDSPVLEVGSININGSARSLWGDCVPYVGVDIVSGANVDCVVDIRDWNVINNRKSHPYLYHDFRTILCTEVLEHVPPDTIINALWPYMGEDCQVVITAASLKRRPHSADGAPTVKDGEYYKNVKPETLLELLSHPPIYIECVDVSVILTEDGTDVYAYAKYRQSIRSV